MKRKDYYVECVGYSSHCFTYKDALALYKYRKMYENEVTLTDENGKVIFHYKKSC